MSIWNSLRESFDHAVERGRNAIETLRENIEDAVDRAKDAISHWVEEMIAPVEYMDEVSSGELSEDTSSPQSQDEMEERSWKEGTSFDPPIESITEEIEFTDGEIEDMVDAIEGEYVSREEDSWADESVSGSEWLVTAEMVDQIGGQFRREFAYIEDAIQYIEEIGAGAVYFGIVFQDNVYEVYYLPE